MNAKPLRMTIRGGALAALVCAALWAQTAPAPKEPPSEGASFSTAESVITELYGLVTFEAGRTPDWEKVRALFIPEAVIVLRTARDKMSVFSVEGFVQDFISFIERSQAERRGFSEKIVRMKPMVYGHIAHVLVLYEAKLGGSEQPPQRGVDSFELVRLGERWWIVSINNEICTAERPAPRELLD